MARTLKQGQRALDNLLRDLEAPEGLAHRYAEAVLQLAIQTASSRPTPQAPMAAAVLNVTGDAIRPSAGGPPAEVGLGSEFGSAVYPQFHRGKSATGYWLMPSAEHAAQTPAGDAALEETMRASLSRFS